MSRKRYYFWLIDNTFNNASEDEQICAIIQGNELVYFKESLYDLEIEE